MKRNAFIILLSCMLCGCANQPADDTQEARQQMQYAQTHTGYADAVTLRYAIENAISPDSAVIALGKKHQ